MPAPLAIQLYTVRELAQNDFEGVVRKIADIGYVGVEPAGYPGTTPEAAGKLFKELGLEVPSVHTRFPVGDDKNEVFDIMHAVDSKRIVAGRGADYWSNIDKIKETCAMINEAAANAKEQGMTVGYHNHWWEFQQVEGRYVYEVMLEELDPAVFFQIDTYWVKVGGPDVIDVLKQMGDRAPLLHIKDGPADDPKADMVAVGQGAMDFPAIMAATAQTAEWHIVELDRCATDMMVAVEESYKYLVSEGLARGNKN
jgi:sugar phosphate isomerase/epimerase